MEAKCEVCEEVKGDCEECERCRNKHCGQCWEKVWSYANEPKDEIRICTNCSSRIHSIESLITRENLRWGQSSAIGLRWFTDSQALALSHESRDTLATYSSLPIDPADAEMIQKDVYFGRTDPSTFPWEYTELIGRVVERAGSTQAYREKVSNVLKAYCGRNSTVGYCQGMNFVTAWILLFMDENSAFWTLTKLIGSTLLPGFYSGAKTGNSLNGFYIEAGVVAKLIESDTVIQQGSTPPSEFADFFCIQLLIQLFVGTVDVPTAIFLWDKLSTEGVRLIQSIALIRGSLALISLCRDKIAAGEHPASLTKQLSDSLPNSEFPSLYSQASAIATEPVVKRLRIEVRDERAKQWRESGQGVLRRLEKVSQFSREELHQFQKAFEALLEEKQHKRSGKLRKHKSRNSMSSTSSQYVEIGISKREFLRLVERLNPSLCEISAQLFDRYDEDKSGYLDFRELIVCLSLLSKGSFEEKLRVCYELFDVDHSGYLSEEELEALLSSVSRHLQQTNTPEEVKSALGPVRDKLRHCLDDDNMVSWSEFHGCITGDPVAFQLFSLHMETAQELRYSTGKLMKAVTGKEEMAEERKENGGQKRCGSCLLI